MKEAVHQTLPKIGGIWLIWIPKSSNKAHGTLVHLLASQRYNLFVRLM
ncbi:MAG: hypothetical protein Q7U35_11235 [Methanobacteriaceae archaeon]|nr:hypothetical protein [Methanobacteriaceae archaeon]MDP2836527.1 hypothetical protein [Methanobacteriaceae archaeon]MDP3622330.1 hypothetical protein [Methanobacteriaceae archaeon]